MKQNFKIHRSLFTKKLFIKPTRADYKWDFSYWVAYIFFKILFTIIGLLLILFIPLIILYMLLVASIMRKKLNNLEINDEGITIINIHKNHRQSFNWKDIKEIRERSVFPFPYPELVLVNDTCFKLKIVDKDEIKVTLDKYGKKYTSYEETI